MLDPSVPSVQTWIYSSFYLGEACTSRSPYPQERWEDSWFAQQAKTSRWSNWLRVG